MPESNDLNITCKSVSVLPAKKAAPAKAAAAAPAAAAPAAAAAAAPAVAKPAPKPKAKTAAPAPSKVVKKNVLRGKGQKKKKVSLRFTIDCTNIAEDSIMDVADFVSSWSPQRNLELTPLSIKIWLWLVFAFKVTHGFCLANASAFCSFSSWFSTDKMAPTVSAPRFGKIFATGHSLVLQRVLQVVQHGDLRKAVASSEII